MTGRERVLNVLNHEKPDRVPLILGADLTTGIQAEVYGRLKERLGVQAEDRYLYDWQCNQHNLKHISKLLLLN